MSCHELQAPPALHFLLRGYPPNSTSMAGMDQPASSAGTLSPPSTGGSGCPWPHYVRVIHLDVHERLVGMEPHVDAWDLQYFAYPNKFGVEQLCEDARRIVAGNPSGEGVYLTVCCELFGPMGSPGRSSDFGPGTESVVLMESHPSIPLPLSESYAWKDASFVSDMMLMHRRKCDDWWAVQALKNALPIVAADAASRAGYLVDRRFQLGWFDDASDWLSSVVTSTGATVRGRVVQVKLHYMCTLLEVDSTAGWHYLKAVLDRSPIVPVTRAVASLLPHHAWPVLATSERVNAFVCSEFSQPADLDATALVLMLADLQLQSRAHLDTLRQAGCPNRTPPRLRDAMQAWA